MKINFILPSIGSSGGIEVVKKYADMMSKAGHDVVIYKEILAPNMHRYNSVITNTVHRVWCSVKAVMEMKNKGVYDQFVMKISGNSVRQADVMIATSWPTAYKVYRLPDKCGKKYYFIQDFEIWDNRKFGIESYKLPLKKIVISSWINNRLKEELGIGPFPVVYNGLETELYNCENRTSHRGINFLMLNHKLRKKGVKEGLEVYRRIHHDHPEAKLRMFGMCTNDNIPHNIEYHQNPLKDELVSLYKDTDIYIFPSLEEGWGLTPLEAMACGCAVIGTNTGFVLDFGKHKDNMMISEPGDVSGMVENIELILGNRHLLMTVQKNGLQVAEKLNWKESAKRFLSLLSS